MNGLTWLHLSDWHQKGRDFDRTIVRDALLHDMLGAGRTVAWGLPVVGETWDGVLNDINGFHVAPEHLHAAIADASGGPVAQGGVGGGTGMICHGFKGGIGTASRVLERDAGGFTVGVLVQANYGQRSHLCCDGTPVGRVLGPERVARFLLGIAAKHEGSILPVTVNGATGLAVVNGDVLHSIVSVTVNDGHVTRVDIVLAPDKLAGTSLPLP